jgi:hypothetical protein
MHKGIWEMLGETLREGALVIFAVGFLEKVFADDPVPEEHTVVVLGVAALSWLSGALMEQLRRE